MPINRRRITLVLTIAAGCAALDQATKLMALALMPAHTIYLLGDLVRLQLSENVGAFMSLGASLPPQLRFWIFTVMGGLLLVPVTVYAFTADDLERDGIIALAAVLGGGIGNLIDRVLRDGRVVDFLNFGIGNLRTGILNVADIFVFFGALYVMGASIWGMARAQQAGSVSNQTDAETAASQE